MHASASARPHCKPGNCRRRFVRLHRAVCRLTAALQILHPMKYRFGDRAATAGDKVYWMKSLVFQSVRGKGSLVGWMVAVQLAFSAQHYLPRRVGSNKRASTQHRQNVCIHRRSALGLATTLTSGLTLNFLSPTIIRKHFVFLLTEH